MKFSETVMLIDTSFLHSVISDLEKNFSRMLGRDLDKVDLQTLVSYIALDAGLTPDADNKVQVLFIYDDLSAHLPHSFPSDVENELNNVAFRNELGEFSFHAFRTEGFAEREAFFVESAKVILSEKEPQRVWVIAELSEKEADLHEILRKERSEKAITLFRMSEPLQDNSLKWELLGYPVMRALGIRGDELNF